MRYWWVNHRKTSKLEISGGFLWSPMQKRNGHRNKFYDNMREASPGDPIVSYSDGMIGSVGVVTAFAMPSPMPVSFRDAGQSWNKEKGWILPINWQSLPIPLKPRLIVNELGSALPEKYSPIDPISGKGRENAYLAEVSKDVFDILFGERFFTVEATILSSGAKPLALKQIDDAIVNEMIHELDIDATTKERLISSRVGQGAFRRNIYDFEDSCRVTKLKNPSFLIASHIKPWRLCSTASERLDGANGLLLAPHVDLLFDRGFLSFEDSGAVIISTRLSSEDLQLLGLEDFRNARTDPFHRRQTSYLGFHRDHVFME